MKDAITAHGIKDAFRDAEACGAALDSVLSGDRPFDDAMAAEFQQERDTAGAPMFESRSRSRAPSPPPPEMLALLGAVAGSPDTCSQFTRMWAGVLPASEFFAPDNVGRMLLASGVPESSLSPSAQVRSL